MDYERPEVCPQPEDPGERSVCAAESIERQIVHLKDVIHTNH
jgi:hypothetical protein